MRRNLVTAAITLALCASTSPVSAQAPAAIPGKTAAQVTTQLPRNVRPTSYDIEVVPHAEKMAFDGKVRINIDVLESTNAITLNAVDMTFANVQLGRANGKSLKPKTRIDAEAQTATFGFDQPLPVGSYLLTMDYTGKIGTQANGLFALDYATPEGKKRALYTQFENSDARKFVPSWDEPNYKATFNLVATVPAAQMAVSNMPIAQESNLPGGQRLVRFATSP